VGLKRGRLSLVSTIEEVLERKSSGSALENRNYGRKDPFSSVSVFISVYQNIDVIIQTSVLLHREVSAKTLHMLDNHKLNVIYDEIYFCNFSCFHSA
jgi:hypothetical protein